MNLTDVQQAERGIGFFETFLKRLHKYDEYRIEARLEAVQAIGKAAAETRAWTQALLQRSEGQNVPDRGQEISELWATASNKIAKFDTLLSYECMVKAYGWRTGTWDNPEYAVIPRRVEEVHAQAMELIRKYQPFLGNGIR